MDLQTALKVTGRCTLRPSTEPPPLPPVREVVGTPAPPPAPLPRSSRLRECTREEEKPPTPPPRESVIHHHVQLLRREDGRRIRIREQPQAHRPALGQRRRLPQRHGDLHAPLVHDLRRARQRPPRQRRRENRRVPRPTPLLRPRAGHPQPRAERHRHAPPPAHRLSHSNAPS